MLNLKVLGGIVAATVLAGSAMPVSAQEPALTVKQLKPNVWVAMGDGGNSTIFVGDAGVVVVDAKRTEAGGKALLAEIAKITPKPVTAVILTHSDGDHVNGLLAFPADIRIISHDNNKTEQEAAIRAGTAGIPADRLPNEIVRYYVTGQGMPYEDHKTLSIEGLDLDIRWWGRAHTAGDLAVSLPAAGVVATGDLIATTRADDNPNVHPEKRGYTLGWARAARGLASIDAEIYVPGHGDLATREDIERKEAATMALRNEISEMIDQDKTVDEIKAALPDAAETFVEIVHSELSF
jgi:glyoxylase-like metal-dependent hydrolase (beta-lactamase superfamily II)